MTSIEPKTEQYDTGRAVLLAVVASARGFLLGFDTALINGAVPAIARHSGWPPGSPAS